MIAFHSFRRGTGKSILAANLAVLLAAAGYRTGLVDTDLASPSTQLLFGLSEDEVEPTLSDHLLGTCSMEAAAHNVTQRLGIRGEGEIYLVPASSNPIRIARLMRTSDHTEALDAALQSIVSCLQLDVLVIDTRAGLTDETLLALAVSTSPALILRADRRDYQGTGVILDLARQLGVPHPALVVNMAPPAYDPNVVRRQVSEIYDCQVAAVLPHSNRLMALASAGIFALRYPMDPFTGLLWDLKNRLVGEQVSQ